MILPPPDHAARAREIVAEWCASTGQTVSKEWLWDEERNGLLKLIARALATVEAKTWEAALRLLADHEDHDGSGTHGRTDGRVSDCIGDLEQVFSAALAREG